MPVTNWFKVQNKLQQALEQVSAHEEKDRGKTRQRERERANMILHSSEEKERERGTEERGRGGVLKWRQTAFEFPAVDHTNTHSYTHRFRPCI